MTPLFILLAALVIAGAAIALAGRWQPEGLPAARPEAGGAPATGDVRFKVVLRGYRMDQVDAELLRLRAMLAQSEGALSGSTPAPPTGEG